MPEKPVAAYKRFIALFLNLVKLFEEDRAAR
jgi:hypothetical protein